MNKYVILTGGNLDEEFVSAYLEKQKDITIICVDGALVLADRLKLPIHYLVGDFDTVPGELLEHYRQAVTEQKIETCILAFKPEKDETDTQIAITLAVEKGAEEIVVLGGTGSRIDHLLANIHLLMVPLLREIKAYILDRNNKVYLQNKTFSVEKNQVYGNYFSLIPLDGTVKGVTLTGFKYNTEFVDFECGSSLGVSNEVLMDVGKVAFSQGVFVVIEARD